MSEAAAGQYRQLVVELHKERAFHGGKLPFLDEAKRAEALNRLWSKMTFREREAVEQWLAGGGA